MVRIELTPEEPRVLREHLTLYLSEFRRQVAGTENPEFRHTLRRGQNLLEEILQRLEQEAAAGVELPQREGVG
jgi:alanyl-tRNA synthetase